MYKKTNIPELEHENCDYLYVTNNGKKILTTEKNGNLKIHDEQNQLLKEIKNHKGPILSISFAGITLPSYIITVGYDRRINLYDLDELNENPLFSFEEENLEYGYFNHVSFLKGGKTSLNFVVSTSNGYVFYFSSDNNFQPERLQIFESEISSLNGLNNGAIVVAAKGEKSRLYFDSSFTAFNEFGENRRKDLKRNFFVTFNNDFEQHEELFLEVEDKTFTIWMYNKDEKTVSTNFSHEFEFNIMNCVWNFGGLSALVTLFDKNSSSFSFSKVCQNIANNSWDVENLKKCE
jgi:WD40 repeat protein